MTVRQRRVGWAGELDARKHGAYIVYMICTYGITTVAVGGIDTAAFFFSLSFFPPSFLSLSLSLFLSLPLPLPFLLFFWRVSPNAACHTEESDPACESRSEGGGHEAPQPHSLGCFVRHSAQFCRRNALRSGLRGLGLRFDGLCMYVDRLCVSVSVCVVWCRRPTGNTDPSLSSSALLHCHAPPSLRLID